MIFPSGQPVGAASVAPEQLFRKEQDNFTRKGFCAQVDCQASQVRVSLALAPETLLARLRELAAVSTAGRGVVR